MQELDHSEQDDVSAVPKPPFNASDWPMHHIMMAFVQHMDNINYVLSDHGIDQRIWRVLTQISVLGAPTVQTLAKAGGFDRSTLSKILMQVEDMGLVDRTSDVKDRRRTNLTLTGDGQKLLQQCAPHVVNLLETYLADFTSQEREMLMRLIKRLRTNVEVEGVLNGRWVERNRTEI